MKKIYILFIAIFITVLLGILLAYNLYSRTYKDEVINDYISKNIDILNENLDTEKRYALSLSLLISQNPIIKKALEQNNQKMALIEIKRVLEDIKRSTGVNNIDIQIHTKDLRAFARNWDKSNYFGTKLGSFRKGLVIVKQSKEPLVSIELGKRLNIKAISPIFGKNREFIGSIEVIMGFENIKKRLKKFNLKMIVLLDEDYINIAVDIQKHKKVGRYYIVGKNYNVGLYDKLVENPKIFKRQKRYYVLGKNLIVVIPMKSVGMTDVGFIVLCMSAVKERPYDIYSIKNIDQENSRYIFDKKRKREVIIK